MSKITRRLFLLSIPAVLGGVYFWNKRKKWKYIVVHHSAGSSGNLKFLKNVHKERFPYSKYMAYHFLIGNGKGMKSGGIAYGKRWKNQIWGAHVSYRNKYKNYSGIGICMIGNFEKYKMGEKQYQGMLSLIKYLKIKYKIDSDNVLFHGKIHKEQTLCPGKNFPYDRLIKDIKKS